MYARVRVLTIAGRYLPAELISRHALRDSTSTSYNYVHITKQTGIRLRTNGFKQTVHLIQLRDHDIVSLLESPPNVLECRSQSNQT